MKTRFLLFGLVFGLVIFLYKRLVDSQEKLVIAEAELSKLQHEKTATEQVFAEAKQRQQHYEAENPFPNDPTKKLRVAMLDAIISSQVKEELGENYSDDEEDES